MHRIARIFLAVAWLNEASSEKLVPSSRSHKRADLRSLGSGQEEFNSLRSLAIILLTCNSAASFNPSLAGIPFATGIPTYVSSSTILNKRESGAHSLLAMKDNADVRNSVEIRLPQTSDEDGLRSLTVKELKDKLKALSLKVSGPKEDLIARLEEHEAEQHLIEAEQNLMARLEGQDQSIDEYISGQGDSLESVHEENPEHFLQQSLSMAPEEQEVSQVDRTAAEQSVEDIPSAVDREASNHRSAVEDLEEEKAHQEEEISLEEKQAAEQSVASGGMPSDVAEGTAESTRVSARQGLEEPIAHEEEEVPHLEKQVAPQSVASDDIPSDVAEGTDKSTSVSAGHALEEHMAHEEEEVSHVGKKAAGKNAASDDVPSAVAERWYVDVPSTFEEMAKQASRAVMDAMPYTGRLIVEAAATELDSTSKSFSPEDLMLFVALIGQAFGNKTGLMTPSRPQVKLLFNRQDAILAGAFIMDPKIEVQAWGYPSSIGPRDGAFVVVSPSLTPIAGINSEAMLHGLMQEAGRRPVVLINPRLGNSPLLSTFTSVYLMRPLSLSFLRNESSKQAEKVTGCVLRCYPHEWSVLYDEGELNGQREKRWRYAGRSNRSPRPEEIEALVKDDIINLYLEGAAQRAKQNLTTS